MDSTDRPVYGTRKHRAADLREGDVTRNRFGKWDEVSAVVRHVDGLYTTVRTVVGGDQQHRTVQLVDVQVVKPS